MSGAPYWPIADGLLAAYPPLNRDVRCAVAVVGAGVTGALVAHQLAGSGLDVVVLDRRDVATGSTAASTALLMYEIDTELIALAGMIGEADAVRAYHCSLEAIGEIERLVGVLGDDCGFARRPSLYLASRRADASRLEREAALRSAHGLPAEFWDRKRIASQYDFRAHGAIRSTVAAQIDPYRFTHRLLGRAVELGARVVDRTAVTGYHHRDGGVELETDRGHTVRADRVVIAIGYEVPAQLRENLVELHSSYALATEPVERFDGWEDRCLIWETARPYLYLRSTGDGRVIVGGEDEPFRDPRRRDRLLPAKTRHLARRLDKLLPSLRAEPAFAWTGTFGSTPDGLPFVGGWDGFPNGLFALGYGANGITFGVVAARIIRDSCLGHANDDGRIFRLDR